MDTVQLSKVLDKPKIQIKIGSFLVPGWVWVVLILALHYVVKTYVVEEPYAGLALTAVFAVAKIFNILPVDVTTITSMIETYGKVIVDLANKIPKSMPETGMRSGTIEPDPLANIPNVEVTKPPWWVSWTVG